MGKLSRVLLSLFLLGLLGQLAHGGEVNSFLSMDEIQFRWRNRNVILATTTSTQDSGLLDVLVPLFQKQRGYTVKTVARRLPWRRRETQMWRWFMRRAWKGNMLPRVRC
jgi:hypothetical protein